MKKIWAKNEIILLQHLKRNGEQNINFRDVIVWNLCDISDREKSRYSDFLPRLTASKSPQFYQKNFV